MRCYFFNAGWFLSKVLEGDNNTAVCQIGENFKLTGDFKITAFIYFVKDNILYADYTNIKYEISPYCEY